LPNETFRIKSGDDQWLVYLCATLDEMRALLRERTGECHPGQLGMCLSVASDDRTLRGALFLSREALGSGLVAHELAHAAFRTCEARGLTVFHQMRPQRTDGLQATHPHEETYCHVLEELTREFWRAYYRLEPTWTNAE
jgi:hypothetical protein